MSSKNKKKEQLGMNPGTANHRLIRDILFRFVSESEEKCYQCGGELTRETFSIEHKIPWLDSDDAVHLFFDLNNISFSHIKCNSGAARKWSEGNVAPHGTHSRYEYHKCRCEKCRKFSSEFKKKRRAITGKN